MVEIPLADSQIRGGIELLNLLDKYNLSPDGAYWLYFNENKNWKLVLSTNSFSTYGPKKTYSKIQSILKKQGKDFAIKLSDIVLSAPHSGITNLLKMVINTNKGISGIRFTHNMINGVPIPDAYIYRLTRFA
jgi:hypothetical protein